MAVDEDKVPAAEAVHDKGVPAVPAGTEELPGEVTINFDLGTINRGPAKGDDKVVWAQIDLVKGEDCTHSAILFAIDVETGCYNRSDVQDERQVSSGTYSLNEMMQVAIDHKDSYQNVTITGNGKPVEDGTEFLYDLKGPKPDITGPGVLQAMVAKMTP